MAKLIYTSITSLDGYTADETGGFGWAAPDEEVHAFVNDLVRPVGTYLYGRRMYEVMRYWEDSPEATGEGNGGVTADFAQIWRAADKVVYSTTLASVSTARTTLQQDFDPGAVRAMKASARSDLGLGGAGLAGQALRAGLVDELHLFVTPVVVGGGTGWLPHGLHLALELLDEHRFGSGVVHLHYRIVDQPGSGRDRSRA